MSEGRFLQIKELINEKSEALGEALPEGFKMSRFTKIALSAIRNNPKLATCTSTSFIGSLMTCAQLGLEPNTPLGQCYIIPYYNTRKRCQEAQFQLGYKGALNLSYRHGRIDYVEGKVVHEKDTFDWSEGTENYIKHKPARGHRGDVTHYYAIYTTVAGHKSFVVWTMDEVLEHAKQYSGSWKGNDFDAKSAWATAFDSMALKTVVIDLMRFAPQSVEADAVQLASGMDGKVVNFSEYSDGSGETVVGESEIEGE